MTGRAADLRAQRGGNAMQKTRRCCHLHPQSEDRSSARECILSAVRSRRRNAQRRRRRQLQQLLKQPVLPLQMRSREWALQDSHRLHQLHKRFLSSTSQRSAPKQRRTRMPQLPEPLHPPVLAVRGVRRWTLVPALMNDIHS